MPNLRPAGHIRPLTRCCPAPRNFAHSAENRHVSKKKNEKKGSEAVSTDVSDTAQLLVFIRGTNSDFEITEELAAMRGMHGTTIGEDLFKEISAVIEGLALPWEKLVGVTTDSARSYGWTPQRIGSKSY